ncbi:MAG: SCO family protein, partial [Nitrospira sp.]|nr:SCO family protein [Nitrospira sp.]
MKAKGKRQKPALSLVEGAKGKNGELLQKNVQFCRLLSGFRCLQTLGTLDTLGTLGTFFAFCLLMAASVYAHEDQPVQPAQSALIRDIGFDQRLGEQLPLDLVFRNEAGQSIQLKDYFGTKPVILVLAYYECPRLCPIVLDGLVSSLRVLSFNVGEQFTVITVSIDPRETPSVAMAKKDRYIQHYARSGTADRVLSLSKEGWHFLTGEEASIHRLAEAVGFRYTYDEKRKE